MDTLEDDDAPLFHEDGTIEAAVGRVLDVLRPMQRGEILLWATIEVYAGFDRESPHWSAFRHRLLRDFRKETGIVLWPVKIVGWKLLTIDEQINWRSRKRMRRAARQLHRDMIELRAIPDAQMTDRQRQERAVREQRAHSQMLAVRRAARVQDMFGQAHRSTRPKPTA